MMNPFMTHPSTFSRSRFVASRSVLGLVAGASLALSACGTTDAPGPLQPTQASGRVRFVNLITDPTRVPANVALEGVPFGVNLAYGGTTPSSLPAPSTAIYSPVYVGNRTIVVRRTADTTVTLATITVPITADQDRTVYATGGTSGGTVTNFQSPDDNSAPAAGQVRVRVVHLAPAAGAVDVFVTAVGADLALATPTLTNVAVNSASAYLSVAAGTYQVRLVPAGTLAAARTAAVSLNIASVALPANGARTIIAADAAAGGVPLRNFVLTDR
jgi:hypothetical protein